MCNIRCWNGFKTCHGIFNGLELRTPNLLRFEPLTVSKIVTNSEIAQKMLVKVCVHAAESFKTLCENCLDGQKLPSVFFDSGIVSTLVTRSLIFSGYKWKKSGKMSR